MTPASGRGVRSARLDPSGRGTALRQGGVSDVDIWRGARRGSTRDRPVVTAALMLNELRSHNFAVLSTVDAQGRPSSAGVNYGVSSPGVDLAIYVMTRRHLQKARNVARDPHVALVVPLTRRVLQFLPPPTIQLTGAAEILDWSDPAGREVFSRFWMGRRILDAYTESSRRGETRICFLRITLDPVVRSYMVGYGIWELRSRMESGAAKVEIR